MQWLGRRKEEDPQEFWRNTAAKRGGEVGFVTFATLLGRSSDEPMELSGLLYTVGDMVWFEDFERDNWLSKVIGGRRKYEKTEISFGREEIRSSQLVSRAAATQCIAGGLPAESIPAASGMAQLFSTPVVQVALVNGTSLFFEMLRRNEFVSMIASGKWPTPGQGPATGSAPTPGH